MLDINSIKKSVATTPCQNGGANFKTHKLKKTSSGFAFKPSIGAVLFAILFTVIGFLFFSIGIYSAFTNGLNKAVVFSTLFGAVFLSVGLYISFHFLKPRVFNKSINYYYKSFKKTINRNTKNAIPLNKIIALQIIGESIRSDKGSYTSFELNLVLNDATRLNVVDHGNLKSLLDDAEVLSKYLDIPIWHAESNKT